jgi:hypothetical protein
LPKVSALYFENSRFAEPAGEDWSDRELGAWPGGYDFCKFNTKSWLLSGVKQTRLLRLTCASDP